MDNHIYVWDNYVYLLPIVLVILILLVYFVKTSNRLNRYRVIITESKKNVDIALTKRYDTISEMLKVAKSFARHEKITFSDLVQLRAGVSINEFNKVIANQEQALGRIYALAEAYPQLRSSEEFVNLQNQIDDENEQLAAAKRIVNNNISVFNQDVVTFPVSIIASMKGLRQIDFLAEEHVDTKGDIDHFDYEV